MKFSLIWKLLFVCAMIVFLGGCTDKVTETVYVDLSLSRYSVAFPVEGGTTSVSVATSDTWGATTSASWITLYSEGSSLVITAVANEDATAIREADITVATSSSSAIVQVRQEPVSAPTISVKMGSSTAPIDSEGGTFTVAVESNCDWTASLAEPIDGWVLSYDISVGLVSVEAGANSGDTINGTIVITAGNGGATVTERVNVVQSSRADNPYFQFTGYWNVYSADCYYGNPAEWIGAGYNSSIVFSEYDYASGLMSYSDWGGNVGLGRDDMNYDAEGKKLKMRLGWMAGSISYYYVYLVAFDEDFNGFSSGDDENPFLEFVMQEDGSLVVQGMPEGYPVLGYVGTYGYGYYYFPDQTPYCKSPFTLTKDEKETPSAFKSLSNGITVSPVTELPEGIPDRLPKGFVGEVSGPAVVF